MPERELTRRQAMAASGALGLAVVLGACGQGAAPATRSTPAASGGGTCVLAPEQTEGPYYLDRSLIRRDISDGQPGVPLELRLSVQRAGDCQPIRNALVEVWHANALGVYSGVGAAADPARFLRGGQRSGGDGRVSFHTVYPGWYPGRAPHVHVKVHVGGDVVHTGQLYFDQAISESVYRMRPYASRGAAGTSNAADGIYADGGRRSTLALRRAERGYVGELGLGVKA